MHKEQLTNRNLTFALVAAALLLSGCEATSNWLKGRKTAEATDIVGIDGEQASPYLVELEQLASGDVATQAEIFADAESVATLTPGTSTRLRYALVLASPGHAGTDPAAAQRILRDLLTQPELMTATEAALARIFLNNIETQIGLSAEARRLRAENTRAATTEEAAVAQRMARIEAENRQLREQLSDAESKLEAITSIERSMREQAEAPDPR